VVYAMSAAKGTAKKHLPAGGRAVRGDYCGNSGLKSPKNPVDTFHGH